ncbi:hypothetical protein HanHA89_Chr07g0275811 [Helianthus annuus]|nr:hypothetical protein HanHA89_Chr07g0275811 [Helianthus annuus]
MDNRVCRRVCTVTVLAMAAFSVREIEREAHEEVGTLPEKDAKQYVALDLISRLKNHRFYDDDDDDNPKDYTAPRIASI